MGPKAVYAMKLGLITLVFGCDPNVPPPNDEWAAAQADVDSAQTAGAPDVPDAKVQLQLAQEDLRKSKGLMGDDNRRAASLCAVARAEAQLALSLAKQAKARQEARRYEGELHSH